MATLYVVAVPSIQLPFGGKLGDVFVPALGVAAKGRTEHSTANHTT